MKYAAQKKKKIFISNQSPLKQTEMNSKKLHPQCVGQSDIQCFILSNTSQETLPWPSPVWISINCDH